ncbi:MAG: NADH-quinone oxidoreductase subunit H [Patescibacteria group bacterium]
MSPIVLTILQVCMACALAPMTLGLVAFFKARLLGRHGLPPWSPYFNYRTLLKKETLIPASASWLFVAAPIMVLLSSGFLVMVLPLLTTSGVFSSLSNFLVIAGVLALGSVFVVLSGLDTGNTYSGLGSSRHLVMVGLLEPTVILTFAALALSTGSGEIVGMLEHAAVTGQLIGTAPYLALSLLALVLVSLAENSRYPISEPGAEATLAMGQEVTTFDYSGPLLAMLEYAAALKLTVFALLVANFILPRPLLTDYAGVGDVMSVVLATVLKLILMMIALAILESSTTKMRFYRVQEFLTGAFFMALCGLALALLMQRL